MSAIPREGTMKRYAIVRNARSQREVEAYLPANYTVKGSVETGPGLYLGGGNPHTLDRPPTYEFVIEGRDVAGWTLEYVIPRLASGLIFADEIDLSHPIMKEIPA
jgi:hypothetical protein